MNSTNEDVFRVLHIMGALDAGGISSLMLNYYSRMDQERIRFDIAVTTKAVGKDAESFRKTGSRIYTIPMKSAGIKPYTDALRKILSETHYNAIHVHERDTSYVALRVAKKMGVPKRVAHAHGSLPVHGWKARTRLLASAVLNPIYATNLLACDRVSGERAYGRLTVKGREFRILPNAIDTERFSFHPDLRAEKRKELGVENQFVLGMVGRIEWAKNIPFSIRVVEKLHQRMPDITLLLVGNGNMQPALERMVQEIGLADRVKFLGRQSNPEVFDQVFDVLLMPSLLEGFPLVAVEAMSSGLPVLLADTITDELNFGSAVQYLPLNDPDQWVENLIRLREEENEASRMARQHEVKDNGYDIRDTVNQLEEIYGII